MRLGGAGHHQQATRVLVEAMHEPGTRHQSELRIEREERVLQRVAGVAGPGVHDQSGGLVDDEERAVLEHHRRAACASAATPASHRQLRLDVAPAPRRAPGPWRRSGRPSTWTAPDSIHSFRRAREYCGSARARAWSKRRPGASRRAASSACERNSAGACRGRKGGRGIRYTGRIHTARSQRKALSKMFLSRPARGGVLALCIVLLALSVRGCHAPQDSADTTRIPRRPSTRRRTRPWSAYDFNVAIKTYER